MPPTYVTLELDLPTTPAWVEGDRFALGLLIRNLLENALKFTPEGNVVVSVKTVDDSVCVGVRDSGPGIHEDALPHLFERFFQADVRHRQGGSGLGLALAKSIALGTAVHSRLVTCLLEVQC